MSSITKISLKASIKGQAAEMIRERIGSLSGVEATDQITLPSRLQVAMGEALQGIKEQASEAYNELLQNSVVPICVSKNNQLKETVTDLIRMDKTLKILEQPEFSQLKELTEKEIDLSLLRDSAKSELKVLGNCQSPALENIKGRASSELLKLKGALHHSHKSMLQVQSKVVEEITNLSMVEIGYSTKAQHSASTTIIRGAKPGNAFIVSIRGDGSIVIDSKSSDGKSCRPEAQKLQNSLRKRGLAIETLKDTFYGKRFSELRTNEEFNPLDGEDKAHYQNLMNRFAVVQKIRTS